MTKISSTDRLYFVFRDELPTVHQNKKGIPYVNIPDPNVPGETIHFLSIPGDKPDDLYNLAAAYLALAQNMERSQS